MFPYYIPKSAAFYLKNYGHKNKFKIVSKLKKLVDIKTVISSKKHSYVERGNGSYDSTSLFLYIRHLL